MLPHSELDNYKLQVELLQEKLQRSEENRKKLENKLEHAIQRKSENEKVLRAKQRQKYQDFLGDLERRNERNRQLMQMLERIDQQTAALSARSERVRMMKMQYEMYFAKLVQSQTMRCIQGAVPLPAASAPIPVLLPTAPPMPQTATTTLTATPIKNNESEVSLTPALAQSAKVQQPVSAPIYQCNTSGNLIAPGIPSAPVTYTQGAPDCNTLTTTAPQHWTLAMATPTPAGMLLTTTPTTTVMPAAATDYVATAPNFDYMQYPLGYLPRMRRLLQSQHQPQHPHMSIYSDESDDLLQPPGLDAKSGRQQRTNKHYDDENMQPKWAESGVEQYRHSNRVDLPTRHPENGKKLEDLKPATAGAVTTSLTSPPTAAAALMPTTLEILRKDNQQQEPWQGNEEKHELKQRQRPEQLLSGVSTTSSATPLTLDKLPKMMTVTEHEAAVAPTAIDDTNNDAYDGIVTGDKPQSTTRFDEFSKGISISSDVKGALQIRTSDEEKTLPMADNAIDVGSAVTSAPAVISTDNESTIEPSLRQKIDTPKPWQQQQLTQSWHRTGNKLGAESTSNGKDTGLSFEEMTGGFTEFTENKVTNNVLKSVDNTTTSSTVAPTPATSSENNTTNTKVSIEKIENEIYGELVNPPTDELEKNDARNAAQGLLTELVTQQHLQPETQEIADDPSSTSAAYEQSSASESYDPTYATIDGTTNAEVYPIPSGAETGYAIDANVDNNYAQYANDANAAQSQEDYANIDYSNYDASQYNTTEAYDPNMYPGYTYDEATGQYTADPTPQYTGEEATAGYDAQSAYDQQQYDMAQQDQNYDYTNYGQPEADPNAAYDDPIATTTTTAAPVEPTPETATTNVEPAIGGSGSTKPTSILSTTDKHGAANEAQKKKKRVNFVDSSETDDSSTVKPAAAGSESDFDFSSSEKSAT